MTIPIKKQQILIALLAVFLEFSATEGLRENKNMEGSCDLLLDTFAANTATFTYCAIRNARPITFCESCVSEYIAVLQAYEDIFEKTDETGNPCKIKLLNLDRLEIIEVIFKSVSELWGRGYCNYCFETTKNGTLTSNLRNSTLEFNRRHQIVKECISEHGNDTEPNTVCLTCRITYNQLNSYYNKIKMDAAAKDGDNVCMDIVDLMNATRIQWSQELHCVPARQSQVPLFVSASLLLATPVVFYALSMLLNRSGRRTDIPTTMPSESDPPSSMLVAGGSRSE